MAGFLITGTDTGVGKTRVTSALVAAGRELGRLSLAMKPVASGCAADGKNEDVEQLLDAMRPVFSEKPGPFRETVTDLVNIYTFQKPIAPSLAASAEQCTIRVEPIVEGYTRLSGLADLVFVEGLGGFCVPLAEKFDAADLACVLGLPVILVVGMRLGCINHALLTQEAIFARRLTLAGWVANCIDPAMAHQEDNIELLQTRLHAPLMGILGWQEQGPDPIREGLARLLETIAIPDSLAQHQNKGPDHVVAF